MPTRLPDGTIRHEDLSETKPDGRIIRRDGARGRKAKPATPAQRAKARRDPAIFQPPPRVRGDRQTAIKNLTLRVNGRAYPIGPNIEGDTPWSMGVTETGTVTLPVRDPSRRLPRVLDNDALELAAATVTIDGVIYTVSGVEHDGDGLFTLTLEDEVSARMDQFDDFMVASRATTTRFGFIERMVREASRKPYPPMRAFIPEVDDKRPIAKRKGA